ncbi:hypothetical protein SAMN02745164_01534 [Marinitoga hydrogenitolerans DSM 16785]|uniref:Uncharacterized protein n=1 Tax=Marinitoga hydrogenitolerans (strain DSM 16785 / JCM 12826 / AT1271) TaxID=1122195 RepID=A0A1M4XWG1_MARH1|nr:hypothetical protein [Marinitoga hydrogenitolerans]SHE97623.1 hypothetical protein SAMN02745164_01534 [Marinitoga hydrogenitolerans DSM 16785]
MKKWLILFLLFVNFTYLFGVKIITTSNDSLTGTFLSINAYQLFFKIENKVNKLPINEIKTIEFTPTEKSNMFFSLKNYYTFKGYLEKIEKDYFIFKDSNILFKIYKSDLKIAVSKNRVTTNRISTKFGNFHFSPIEIISDKFWKIKTEYGEMILPSIVIESSFRPNISSENKNILYLNNGDYFFYDTVNLKNSLFDFFIYNFYIQIPKEKILFLKNHSYIPKKVKSNKLYRLNINDKDYYIDDFDIKENKIYIENKIIETPKIKFLSQAILNLYIINDIFYSGVSANNNSLFISGYSKKLYKLDLINGIKNIYDLNSYSYDFPVIYNNKIFLSGFRNNLIVINNEKSLKEFNVGELYSGVTILNKDKYLMHLWSDKLLVFNSKNETINSFKIKTSKRSPLIDYENNIIDLDIFGNLYKFDNNLNPIFHISLNGKTDYFNIDTKNNIYISGPDNKFTILDKNGNLLFSYNLDDIPYSFPLIDEFENTIYIALKNKFLYALNNGEILWKTYVGYAPGTGVLTKKYIILTTLNHNIIFVNKENGKIEKEYKLGYSTNLSMDENGFLYSASSKGVVSIIDVNDKVVNQYKFNAQHTGNPNIK